MWGDHLNILASFREHSSNLKNVLTGEPLLSKEHCIIDLQDTKQNTCTLSNYEIVEK
jgi:hypothetical protein